MFANILLEVFYPTESPYALFDYKRKCRLIGLGVYVGFRT